MDLFGGVNHLLITSLTTTPSLLSPFLQHLTTLFLLHGYHTLELFSELEEEDLDELCITQPEDRAKIVTAAQLLLDYEGGPVSVGVLHPSNILQLHSPMKT